MPEAAHPDDYAIRCSDARLADLLEAALTRSDGSDVEDAEDIEEDIQYEPGIGPPSAKTRFKRVIVPLPALSAHAGRSGQRARSALPLPAVTSGQECAGSAICPSVQSRSAPQPANKKQARRKQSVGHARQRRGVRAGVSAPTDAAAIATIDGASSIASQASALSLWPQNGYVNAAKRKASVPAHDSVSHKKRRVQNSVPASNPELLIGQPAALRSCNGNLASLPDPGPAAVDALKAAGYQILASDPSSAGVVLDADGVITAVRARRPQGDNWDSVVAELDSALAKLHTALGEEQAEVGKGVNRWDGIFKHIFWGLSFGGGQREPNYLAIKNKYHPALKQFTENPAVRAYAKHIRQTMEIWQPEVLKECDALADALAQWRPDMLPAYPGLPLFAESANTGDQAVAPDHYDMFNAIDKFCFVIPTGTYDPKKHGLIVLHELKVAIEAAPGDVVFFPSALIRHGNTPIAPTAIRRSWTLFTAGSLYRWWDAGFRTLRSMSSSERKAFKQLAAQRLKERMARHMTLEQLKMYRSKRM